MIRFTVAGSFACLAVVGCIGPSDNIPDPKSQAVYDVAQDEWKRGNLRETLGKVEEALKLDRNNGDASLLGAHVYLAFCAKDAASSDCRFESAEKFARDAVAHAPESREAKNTLGVILVHRKSYDDAIEVLKPLSEDILYASPQMAWGNLGWAYLEKGDVDLAIDALRRSVASQPAFCVGNHRLGLAYEKKGDFQAAKSAFTRALETDRPQCQRIQETWEGRARVLTRLGMIEDARKDLERCSKLSTTSASGSRCGTLLTSISGESDRPTTSAPKTASTDGPT